MALSNWTLASLESIFLRGFLYFYLSLNTFYPLKEKKKKAIPQLKLKSKMKSCIAEWRNNVRTSPKLLFNLEWCRVGGACLLSIEKKKIKIFLHGWDVIVIGESCTCVG